MVTACPSTGDDLFDRPLGPAECALVCALPLTLDDFRADAEAATARVPETARGDFAATHSFDKAARNPDEGWTMYGASVANYIRALAQDAAEVGIGQIVLQADASAVSKVFAAKPQVVILVAHWRSDGLRDRDLVPDFLNLARQRIAAGASPFEISLKAVLDKLVTDAGNRMPRDRSIAAALSAFVSIDGQDAAPDRRALLDDLLSGLIVPGGTLELRDGYHRAEAVERLVPDSWSGVIDLGVCTSMRLAIALKADRDDRRVLCGLAPRYPMRCLPEFRETILQLACRPQGYIPLRTQVHKTYNRLMKDAGGEDADT